jgi:hypothetical protein
MGRRILIVVLALVLALFAYLGYNSYGSRRAGASGDVFSVDSPRDTSPTEKVGVTPPSDGTGASSAVQKEQPLPTTEAQHGGGIAQGRVPSTDTISPNPPNGMMFSGTGKYQLYRQGNLTWRMNTETGETCILFATDEEWQKPKVYRAGCRGRR